MDVGATLRRARNQKRLTLNELSRATKISVGKLQALEDNDFDRLPALVYTRGFLRSYAREVGLDPDETVDQYLAQIDETTTLAEAEGREEPPELGEPVAWQRRAANAPMAPLRIQIDLKSLPRPAMAAAAVLLAVALIAAFAWRGGDGGEQIATAEAVHDAETAEGSAAAPGNDATHAANVATDDPLRIELKTTGPCWVSASADRAPVLARLLQAGERETIEAKDEFVLRVGDPSTISLTINGAPLRPLGQAGMPVTVQINRDNYRELLAS
jgi:transcriptional regulator with XRE-family HTH domain